MSVSRLLVRLRQGKEWPDYTDLAFVRYIGSGFHAMQASFAPAVRSTCGFCCFIAAVVFAVGQDDTKNPISPLPADCRQQTASFYGMPVFTHADTKAQLGLSIEHTSFLQGQKVTLHIWVNNPGQAVAYVMTCEDLDYFKTRGFDLYDRHGHLLLTRQDQKAEQQCNENPKLANFQYSLFVCLRNFAIPVAAHTCMTGDDYDFTLDLSSRYDLSPQHYRLHLRQDWKPRNICELGTQTAYVATPEDLRFSVEP